MMMTTMMTTMTNTTTTEKNIRVCELVGLNVTVRRACNEDLVGLTGKVTDETRNMIVIIDSAGRNCKYIPKAGTEFLFSCGGATVQVDGHTIQKRPFERV